MMTTNWEQSSKLILLPLHEKLLKNSLATILQLFGIWSKLERWKSYISWLSWLKVKKKKTVFEMSSSLFLLHNKKEPLLDLIVTCDEKWILHNNWQWSTQWLDWEAPKHCPKANLHTKNVVVTDCLADLIHYSFLNATEAILRTMLSNLMRRTKNCNACSWYWSTERAQFSIAMHGYMSYNQRFKIWMNWSMKVCLICHVPLTSG